MTKPLIEEQAFEVFDTILRSARGELKDEETVSRAQLGAFFAGMTIRALSLLEATQWSEGERRAVTRFWHELVRVLPPDVVFIADPEGSIMSVGNSIGPRFVGNDTTEMRLVGALREVLVGGHIGYEEVQGVLRDVLPLDENENSKESLVSAFLIGQRMNMETDRELKAYCLAFDDELGKPSNCGPVLMPEDPVGRKGHLHRCCPICLPRLQSAPALWNPLDNRRRSLLLDACHPRFQ
ncbi:hypothetical protein LINGRAHAP2_LOCUS24067 [Linum grandiflorum]